MLKSRDPRDTDYDGALDCARSMHEESWYVDFTWSPIKFRNFWQAVLDSPDFFGRIIYDDQTEDIVGFFAGYMAEHYFSYEKYACEVAMYIDKKNRGKGAFVVLGIIDEFEKWAATHNCMSVAFGVTAGITDERSIKLYEKLGYVKSSQLLHKKCI